MLFGLGLATAVFSVKQQVLDAELRFDKSKNHFPMYH